MERVGKAGAGTDDRPDIAAVTARHGDDGRAMDATIVDSRERAGESLAGDDVGIRIRAAKHEPVRIARRIVEVAVGEQVDMRVSRFATLAEDVGERRIDQNRQQLAELLAPAVGGLRRIVASGIRERPDCSDQRVAMLP